MLASTALAFTMEPEKREGAAQASRQPCIGHRAIEKAAARPANHSQTSIESEVGLERSARTWQHHHASLMSPAIQMGPLGGTEHLRAASIDQRETAALWQQQWQRRLAGWPRSELQAAFEL